MSTEAMILKMKSLKLHGMAHSIGDLAEQGSSVYLQAVPLLEQLLKAEVAEREVRSIQCQMKIAPFPT